MVENLVGTPARGDDFFGREALAEYLWERLEKGHVLLAAPRRFGKTSLMYRLIDFPRDGFRLIHADLEHMDEAAELITELVYQLSRDSRLGRLVHGIGAIGEKLWSAFRDNVEEIELYKAKVKLKENVGRRWKENGDELFKRLAASTDKVVFILDEFPMMLERMERDAGRRAEARALLRWLRSLRMTPDASNARFLLAGSIGIDHVLKRLGESASINDFERIPIEPFPPKTASAFLDALAASSKLPLKPAVKKRILDLIGPGVPYFLQVYFSEIHKAVRLSDIRVTPKTVEAIYRDRVLGVDCKAYFERYFGRLKEYYDPEDERAAKRILRALAESESLTRNACLQLYARETTRSAGADADPFHALMTNLENDFYIRYDDETRRYTFSCKILRDWWLRHFGLDSD